MALEETSSACATKLRAVSDPTRLRVMEILRDGPRCVRDLMAVLEVEQSLLSHHLRVLRDAKLVVGERSGKEVRYQLAHGAVITSSDIDLGCCKLSFEATESHR